MRAINVPMSKSEVIQIKGIQKGRGRPKIPLVEVVKKRHVN
jgi:hypothetical protein